MPPDKVRALSIACLTVVDAGLLCCPGLGVFRPLLALPLVLLLPGLCLVRLARPNASLDLHSITLFVGLSLATTVASGLALNALSSLAPIGWTLTLSGLTLLFCLAQLLLPLGEPLCVAVKTPRSLSIAQICVLLAAACVAALGVALSREGALAQREYSYTEFWMTPRSSTERNIVAVGIKNQEKVTTSYRVVILARGATVDCWPAVRLAPGETWSTDIALSSSLKRFGRVEAWLYREDMPGEVYRKVWITTGVG